MRKLPIVLAILFLSGCPQPKIDSSYHSLEPLREGEGIHQIGFTKPNNAMVLWQPPFYAIVGEKTSIGQLDQESHSLEGQLADIQSISWSNDGSRIAMAIKASSESTALVPNENNNSIFANRPSTFDFEKEIDKSKNGTPYLSPDGKQVVIAQEDGLGCFDYLLYDLVNKQSKEIDLGKNEKTTSKQVFWSRDSRYVARLVPGKLVYYYDCQGKTISTHATDAAMSGGWSGKYLALLRIGTDPKVFLHSPENDEQKVFPLKNIAGTVDKIEASPNEQWIAFNSRSLRPEGIYLLDLAVGETRRVVPPANLIGWIDSQALLCSVDTGDGRELYYRVNIAERK